MKTLLSQNPFQGPDPSTFGALAQKALGQSRQTVDGAWGQFSSIMDASMAKRMKAAKAAQSNGMINPRARSDDPNYSDNFSQYGFANNVPRSLINTESGGNWGARNNEVGSGGRPGHYGILQFGNARLDDARRAGVIPQNMTPEQFMQSRDAQVAAANWHFQDIDNRIRRAGYDRYIGQNIGGTPMTWDGMRAMAHLGGFGGLSKFIKSGGRSNPADSFGTSLAAYGRTHSQY